MTKQCRITLIGLAGLVAIAILITIAFGASLDFASQGGSTLTINLNETCATDSVAKAVDAVPELGETVVLTVSDHPNWVVLQCKTEADANALGEKAVQALSGEYPQATLLSAGYTQGNFSWKESLTLLFVLAVMMICVVALICIRMGMKKGATVFLGWVLTLLATTAWVLICRAPIGQATAMVYLIATGLFLLMAMMMEEAFRKRVKKKKATPKDAAASARKQTRPWLLRGMLVLAIGGISFLVFAVPAMKWLALAAALSGATALWLDDSILLDFWATKK